MPFSSDIREKLYYQLTDFGEKVTNYQKAVKEGIENKEHDSDIRSYVSGIRASTDIGSRKLRFEALNRRIQIILFE